MKERFNPIYRIGHTIARIVMQVIFRAEGFNVEVVPKEGPFLLACNHASFLDPFLAGCFIKRNIYFFARKSLFTAGFGKWILERFNAIPVERDSGKDISALKKVFELLNQGEGVLVFLEGTRTMDGMLQDAKKGVGMMACRAQVPVIPTRIIGSFDVWGRGKKYPRLFLDRMNVIYGSPLYPKDYDPGREDPDRYQKASNKILEAIAALKTPSTKAV